MGCPDVSEDVPYHRKAALIVLYVGSFQCVFSAFFQAQTTASVSKCTLLTLHLPQISKHQGLDGFLFSCKEEKGKRRAGTWQFETVEEDYHQ